MLLKTLSNQFKRQNQSMANIGKLTTFSRLIAEESVIMIPKVQRDYAYGRNEEKVREVLTGMLDTMFSAVKNDRSELFDFVCPFCNTIISIVSCQLDIEILGCKEWFQLDFNLNVLRLFVTDNLRI